MRKFFAGALAVAAFGMVACAVAAQTSKVGAPSSHVPYVGAIQVPFGPFSTLPLCDAFNLGIIRGVTDATTPTYNGTITGGSNVPVIAVCNGVAWKTM